MERNALLETEISHGEKLKEVIQRLKDEKRDLKSELENKGHGQNIYNDLYKFNSLNINIIEPWVKRKNGKRWNLWRQKW